MFDDFDLYESCEEYYSRNRVIDSYQYYLTDENRITDDEEEDFFREQ